PSGSWRRRPGHPPGPPSTQGTLELSCRSFSPCGGRANRFWRACGTLPTHRGNGRLFGSILVFRHGRIDLVGPSEDAAFEVFQLAESLFAEEGHRLGAAHAALAMNHHFAVRVQFAET